MAKRPLSKGAREIRTDQLNPAHPAYHRSRGVAAEKVESLSTHAQPALENYANQSNPSGDALEQSRGMSSRPDSSSNASSANSEGG